MNTSVLARDSKEDFRTYPEVEKSSLISGYTMTEDEAFSFVQIVNLYIASGFNRRNRKLSKLVSNAEPNVKVAFRIFKEDIDGWRQDLLSQGE